MHGTRNVTYRTDVIHIGAINWSFALGTFQKFEYFKTLAVFIHKYKNEATEHYEWTNSLLM